MISGIFERIARERLDAFLKELGCRVTGSVSGKTDYLFLGSKLEDGRETTTGRKYLTAKAKGTPIMDESQVEEFLREKLDNKNFVIENY